MCFIMKGFLLSRTLLHIAKTIKIKENSLRLFSPPKGGFYNRKLRPSTIYWKFIVIKANQIQKKIDIDAKKFFIAFTLGS